MPNPNIFFWDEDNPEDDDALDKAERAAQMAAEDNAQLQHMQRLAANLSVDGDDYIPNAALVPFNRVQELIRIENKKQGKLVYQATPAPSDHFTVEVDDIIMVCCYYGLLIACFLMVLSLLIHK